MHSCFSGKTVVFQGTVDECNEFRHIIVAISLFCIVRRIGKVLINIELKNHTIGKQIDKLQAGLYTSVSVVEQTRIRKNMQASLSYSRDMKSGTGTDGKWR